MSNKEDSIRECSFCGKTKEASKKLIVGENAGICDECVRFCGELLGQDMTEFEPKSPIDLDPIGIKKHLDDHVIGQEKAKIMLAVAVANHYKRIGKKTAIELDKANVLFLGPTGCGKTMLARAIAKYLDVPFAIADATSLTEAGYVGDDAETMIARLLHASGGDVKQAERGIIFIDELDKIARKSESTSITRDVSGEGVQQALLKIVEGTKCRVNLTGNRKHPSGAVEEVDTTNILFIAGGAFVGLEQVIKNRIKGSGMGFGSTISKDSDSTFENVIPDDLLKYGLIPELVGRFTDVVHLDELDEEQLCSIMTDVKNNLVDQYKYLFSLDQILLDVRADAIRAIAKRTQTLKTGARGLHTEFERALLPHMYNARRYRDQGIKTIIIDEKQIENPTVLVDVKST